MIFPILGFSTNALFHGVLVHLLESSLVGLAVLGIIVACRGSSAALRRTLGWVGLLKFALPAAILAPVLSELGQLVERFTSRPPSSLAAELPGFHFLMMGTSASADYPETLVVGVLGSWAVVTTVLLLRWAAKASAFRSEMTSEPGHASERVARVVSLVAARHGLRYKPVKVVMSISEGPGVLGFVRPLLVIPRSLETLLNPFELDSVLVHELVHLKRRDYLWGSVRTAFLAIFWHNPVVWLLCRSVALETEKACDEEVIRLTGSAQVYADGILKTVRHSLGLTDPSLMGAAGHSISSRVKSILSPRSKIESHAMKITALASACLVAVLGVCAEAASDAPTVSKSELCATDLFAISKLTVMPKVLLQVRPVYPPDLHARGVAGEVLVDFTIDPKGNVQNAFAAKTTGSEFAKSAVESVSQWKFDPGQVDGRAVNTHMRVPIVFTITPAEAKPNS